MNYSTWLINSNYLFAHEGNAIIHRCIAYYWSPFISSYVFKRIISNNNVKKTQSTAFSTILLLQFPDPTSIVTTFINPCNRIFEERSTKLNPFTSTAAISLCHCNFSAIETPSRTSQHNEISPWNSILSKLLPRIFFNHSSRSPRVFN